MSYPFRSLVPLARSSLVPCLDTKRKSLSKLDRSSASSSVDLVTKGVQGETKYWIKQGSDGAESCRCDQLQSGRDISKINRDAYNQFLESPVSSRAKETDVQIPRRRMRVSRVASLSFWRVTAHAIRGRSM